MISFGAVSVLSIAIWWICVQQLKQPIAQRNITVVLILQVLLTVAVVAQLGTMFEITGLPLAFTVKLTTPIAIIVSFLLWKEFVYKGLKILPQRK